MSDKAREKGHYVFHSKYVEVEPLESKHDTFYRMEENTHCDPPFHCKGDEVYCDQRMENIREGFELVYTFLSEEFPVRPV